MGEVGPGFKGVQRCGSVWTCPVCAVRVGRARAEEVRQGIETFLAGGADRSVAMVTFTASHHLGDRLADWLVRFLGALQRLRQSRIWRRLAGTRQLRGLVEGTIGALDFTWSSANGWHPHQHLLVLLKVPPSEAKLLLKELRGEWSRSLSHGGLTCNSHGFDVVTSADVDAKFIAKYVAKFGHDPAEATLKKRWGLPEELTAASNKSGRLNDSIKGARGSTPWELLGEYLDTGDCEAGDLFVEYVHATRTRHALQWSDGLKAKLLGEVAAEEKSDQEIANDDAQAAEETLHVFKSGEWLTVCRRRLQARLLNLAQFDRPGLRALLASLGSSETEPWRRGRVNWATLEDTG